MGTSNEEQGEDRDGRDETKGAHRSTVADRWVAPDAPICPSARTNPIQEVRLPPVDRGLLPVLATMTDADGNSSEFTNQLIPLPEPGLGVGMAAGGALLVGRARGGGVLNTHQSDGFLRSIRIRFS